MDFKTLNGYFVKDEVARNKIEEHAESIAAANQQIEEHAESIAAANQQIEEHAESIAAANEQIEEAKKYSESIKNLITGEKTTTPIYYGAKADGITDDTAAIKAAIDHAGTNGTVYFPSGNYAISEKIHIPEGCAVKGDGRANTFITAIAEMETIFETGDENYSEISDMFIDCNEKANYGIMMKSHFGNIKNVVINRALMWAIRANCNNVTIDNIVTNENCNNGLDVAGNCINLCVSNSYIFAYNTGVRFGIIEKMNEGVKFNNTTIGLCDIGVMIESLFLVASFNQCIIDRYKKYGIFVGANKCDGLSIIDTYIGSDLTEEGSIGVFVAYPIKNLLVTGSYFAGHTLRGIHITSEHGQSDSVKIMGCNFRDNEDDIFVDGARNVGIINNKCESAVGIGVYANLHKPSGFVAFNQIDGNSYIHETVEAVNNHFGVVIGDEE